ncbi:hypothetical protein [Variovorax sp. LT1R16]|uniref:hypothetical protein n=1 Tax=Variovorax sp. LT1R16 TaxID=3443728 RepID=UPI003F44CD96
MTITVESLNWRLPWRQLTPSLDLPALQRQLERELADGHPLWGRHAEVMARRVDTDDVLVSCPDGTLATVHLDWAKVPHSRPNEYPSMQEHPSVVALQQVIDADAAEYGDD